MDDSAPPGASPENQPTLNAAFFDVVQSLSERELEAGTADAGWIARCEDGVEYVLKDGTSKNSEPIVPHCEWFCTQFSEIVQIAAPQYKIVRKIDGTLVFGSRFAGGLVDPSEEAGFWYDRVKTGEINLDNISGALSHIYAFDHFVFNHDRHKLNFLVQKINDQYSILAMDYSRAWLRTGFPLPPIPMNAGLNTVLYQRDLASLWSRQYISVLEVDHTLNKIRNIPRERVKRIIEDHPSEWLPEAQKDSILEWWGSADFFARIDAISEGVKNASCL